MFTPFLELTHVQICAAWFRFCSAHTRLLPSSCFFTDRLFHFICQIILWVRKRHLPEGSEVITPWICILSIHILNIISCRVTGNNYQSLAFVVHMHAPSYPTLTLPPEIWWDTLPQQMEWIVLFWAKHIQKVQKVTKTCSITDKATSKDPTAAA